VNFIPEKSALLYMSCYVVFSGMKIINKGGKMSSPDSNEGFSAEEMIALRKSLDMAQSGTKPLTRAQAHIIETLTTGGHIVTDVDPGDQAAEVGENVPVLPAGSHPIPRDPRFGKGPNHN
jgi:hypothetical protein